MNKVGLSFILHNLNIENLYEIFEMDVVVEFFYGEISPSVICFLYHIYQIFWFYIF